MICIYKITSPTRKVYIGQSRTIRHRFSAYKRLVCEDQPALYNSLKKHGSLNHSFDIVHELPNDAAQDVVNRYEDLYMKLYIDAGVELLNIKEAGSFGKHSEETILKLKNKKLTTEHKEILRLSKVGKKRPPFSEEWRKRLGESKRGKKYNLGNRIKREVKQKTPRKGRKMSKSFSEQLSIRMIGNKNWLGKKHKPGTILKMGLSGSKNPMFGKKGGLCPSAKKVVNIVDGTTYNCVADAALSINTPTKSLQKRLCGYWVNNTNLKYL